MTQEDKELLLKDLCARLPYFENWVQFEGKDYIVTGYGHGRVSLLSSPVSSISFSYCPLIEEVKPYLRPMSSMTKDERKIYRNLCKKIVKDKYIADGRTQYGEKLFRQYDKSVEYYDTKESIDWLNEHHFDYRGLIKKELALEAPEDMYKTE